MTLNEPIHLQRFIQLLYNMYYTEKYVFLLVQSNNLYTILFQKNWISISFKKIVSLIQKKLNCIRQIIAGVNSYSVNLIPSSGKNFSLVQSIDIEASTHLPLRMKQEIHFHFGLLLMQGQHPQFGRQIVSRQSHHNTNQL